MVPALPRQGAIVLSLVRDEFNTAYAHDTGIVRADPQQ